MPDAAAATATPGSTDVPAMLEARNRQIAAVHKISGLLSSTLDLDERLRDILAVSMQAVGAVAGTIFLHRPEDDKLVFQYVVGEKSKELTGLTMNATDGVAGAVFQSGEARITNRPRESKDFKADVGENVGFRTESIVTLPLKYQGGVPVGAMQILNKQHGDFSDADLEVLEIVGSIAATAIENAQLHREAQVAAVAHAVGDLSHDIKNKVAPIVGAAYTLQADVDGMLPEVDRIAAELSPDQANELRKAVQWLREDYVEQFDMILGQCKQVQDYTKLIADALKGSITEPQIEPNDVNSIVEAQLKELEPTARAHGVALVRQLGDVPTCRFDRFLVERAVFNLVNNAIPETPEGGRITVRTEARQDGVFPDGRYLLVEVRDTGRGMPPHVLERILRGDAKSTKPGGTGLGTRIVYRAVAAHHGVFEGESQEQVGTAFRLKLPLLAD